MGKQDVYYSYDVDTGEIVAKTQFGENGRVDRWEGIGQKGYGHKGYESAEKFAHDERTDWTRPIGQDPERTWIDRDHVFEPQGQQNKGTLQEPAQEEQTKGSQNEEQQQDSILPAQEQPAEEQPGQTSEEAEPDESNDDDESESSSESAGEDYEVSL